MYLAGKFHAPANICAIIRRHINHDPYMGIGPLHFANNTGEFHLGGLVKHGKGMMAKRGTRTYTEQYSSKQCSKFFHFFPLSFPKY